MIDNRVISVVALVEFQAELSVVVLRSIRARVGDGSCVLVVFFSGALCALMALDAVCAAGCCERSCDAVCVRSALCVRAARALLITIFASL